MTDTTADALARMKNVVQRGYEEVEVSNTKMVVELVRILKQESFIKDYEIDDELLRVKLAYNKNGEPVVENFIKVSKPGQRIYVSKKEILPVMNGRGISIISTSSGLMTGAQAKSKNLGGEYICKVW